MKHTNISRFIALIFLILSSTTTAFFPNLFYSTFQSNEEKNSLKAAYSWTPTPFVIDDTGAGDYTWSQAVTQPWCTGSGTWSDPYIINDISINGYMRNEHSLEIRNSEVFFIINNSRFWKIWGGYHGVVFSNVSNGIFTNNEILTSYDYNSRGISMSDITNITIKNNQIRDIIYDDGIYLENGDELSLIKNEVHDTGGLGFNLVNINDCTIDANEIYSNHYGGLFLDSCDRNNFSKNDISSDLNGIWLEYSTFNNFSYNTIDNNRATGIVLNVGSHDNIIFGNTLQSNDDYGISVGGFTDKPSRNLIYSNYFITNSLGHAAIGIISINYWDNGSLGNYWDDYIGFDGNGDGIGDTPYIINSDYGIQDNYPIWINKIVILINNPIQSQIFEDASPNYNIEITDGTPDRIWYTLGANTTKNFITSNGTINQQTWDWVGDGDVIIRFSANNSLGNIGYSQVTVHKDTTAPIITIISPTPFERFGNITLMYTLSISEPNLDSTWYSLKGMNYTISTMIGKIDQGAWDSCENGTVSITFYANDTLGRLSSQELFVLKDINFVKMWNLSGVPIYIDNTDPNNDWVTIESENPWCRGSGTLLDPYMIENVIINGYIDDSCITVLNSDVYFIIQNCEVFNGVKRGIWLNYTQNGIIAHNIIHDNHFQGVYLWEYCEQNEIVNNEIFNHTGNGIAFYQYCDNNILSENTIYDNDDDGIGFFRYCTDNIITNNNISECGRNGITPGTLGSRTEIIGNIISKNDRGIVIDGGYDCIIEENHISFHTFEGMELNIFNSMVRGNFVYNNTDGIKVFTEERPTPYLNIIRNNTILNNTNDGLRIATPTDQNFLNLIYENFFINNGQNGFNSGGNNYWDNGSIGNYWDDYGGNDLNDDGVGDTAYQISGIPSSKYDLHPIWDDGDDPTPPDVAIFLPTNAQIYGNQAPNFSVSITGLYINSSWYSLLGGSVNHTITEFNGQIDQNLWDEFGNETVFFRVYANDSLGNMRFDEVVIFKDIISPKLVIHSPLNSTLFGIIPPVYEVFINESNFDESWYTFDNGITNITFLGNGSFDTNSWGNLPNGTVTVTFYVRDKAGNIGYSEIKIFKDIIAPDIEILSPDGSDLIGADAPLFEVLFSDPHVSVTWYSLGGYNHTFILNGTLDQGTWDLIMNGSVIITFFINDSVGNIGYDQVIIHKDILAPLVNIISPNPSEIFSFLAPEFELSILEGNLDEVWYSIDNCVTNYTIYSLVGMLNQTAWDTGSDGVIQVDFFANDTLGHLGYANVTVYRDTEAPLIFFEVSGLFIAPYVPEYYHPDLEIKCTVFNSSEIEWVFLCENSTGIFINHTMVFTGANNWSYNLEISSLGFGDRFSVLFFANDSAGNIGINDNSNALYKVEIFDLQKPSSMCSFTPYSGLFNVEKTTLFSISANDGSGSGIDMIMYQINDSGWVLYTQPFDLAELEFGGWQISFYAIDSAGNIEDINTIVVNLMNTTPPSPSQSIPGYELMMLLGICSIITLVLTRKMNSSKKF